MSKYSAVIIVLAVFSAAGSLGGDFRDNDWGAAPYEVLAIEGTSTIGETRPPGWGRKTYVSCINYYGVHLGAKAAYGFIFTPEEKLGMGLCVPDDSDVGSFYSWEEEISRLYGEPDNRDELLIEDESILNVYYRGDAAAIEEGILNEYFALIRYWETEKTLIWLVAEFYDDKLWVHVNYYSREYFEFFREEKTGTGPHTGFRPWFENGSH
jgi:hypothetical protein